MDEIDIDLLKLLLRLINSYYDDKIEEYITTYTRY